MSSETVAVIGATGRTGRPLIQALEARGAHVRAVTRRAGQASTRAVPPELLVARVSKALGFDAAQVPELHLMFHHYNGYGLVGNDNVLRMILGREPADFAQAMQSALSGSRMGAIA